MQYFSIFNISIPSLATSTFSFRPLASASAGKEWLNESLNYPASEVIFG
jgi:hypothetical protein